MNRVSCERFHVREGVEGWKNKKEKKENRINIYVAECSKLIDPSRVIISCEINNIRFSNDYYR